MARPPFRHKGGYDKQLEGLVVASSWKQAISTCEKRIKRGDKSDEALATKAHVLLECPDSNRREQGRKELDALLNKDPPITDIEVLLYITQFAVYRREPDERYASMWERAAKARPNEEELYKRHHSYIETPFPRGKTRIFGTSSRTISYQSPTLDDRERTLYGQLSSKTIAKAAAAGLTSGDSASIGLALHTLEDLLLLVRIYRSQNKYEEALEVLDDSRIGINSPIGKKQWTLVRQKIELLELSRQWEALWDYCQTLLEDASTKIHQEQSKPQSLAFGRAGDDWKVWTGLLAATSHISTKVNFALTEGIIQSCASYSRNARLALLQLYASDPVEGVDSQAKLLSACLQYFEDYSAKVVCFHDLRPYVVGLSSARQWEFLKLSAEQARNLKPLPKEPESKAISWITAEINVLKLDYFLHVSKHPNYHARSLLEAFICNALRLYRISLKLGLGRSVSERRPGDDVATLAAMAMFHIFERKDVRDNYAMIRSCVILNCILTGSKHNYDALALQVRLYLLLGSTSLAIDSYSQLSVKNIQHATLSWMLFSRLSTLHPHPVCHPISGKPIVMDPSELLKNALNWHKLAESINKESIVKMLRQGQYDMLLDALGLGNTLAKGYSKILTWCELRRLERLTNASWNPDYTDTLVKWTGEVEDNMDFAAFPNCESSLQDPESQHFMSRVVTMEELDRRWLLLPLKSAWLWDHFHNKESIDANAILSMHGTDADLHEYMTPVECGSYRILKLLQEQCGLRGNILRSPHNQDRERLMQENFSAIEKYLASRRHDLNDDQHEWANNPSALDLHFSWSYFNWNFVVLDLCQICRAAARYLVSANKISPGVDATFLEARCHRLDEAIRDLLAQMKLSVQSHLNTIRREDAAKNLAHMCLFGHREKQDAIGKALEPLVGQGGMESKAAAIVESWADATEGILKAIDQVGNLP